MSRSIPRCQIRRSLSNLAKQGDLRAQWHHGRRERLQALQLGTEMLLVHGGRGAGAGWRRAAGTGGRRGVFASAGRRALGRRGGRGSARDPGPCAAGRAARDRAQRAQEFAHRLARRLHVDVRGAGQLLGRESQLREGCVRALEREQPVHRRPRAERRWHRRGRATIRGLRGRRCAGDLRSCLLERLDLLQQVGLSGGEGHIGLLEALQEIEAHAIERQPIGDGGRLALARLALRSRPGTCPGPGARELALVLADGRFQLRAALCSPGGARPLLVRAGGRLHHQRGPRARRLERALEHAPDDLLVLAHRDGHRCLAHGLHGGAHLLGPREHSLQPVQHVIRARRGGGGISRQERSSRRVTATA